MELLPSALVVLAATTVVAGTASAATVTGTLRGGSGKHVVLVQANGKARAATPTSHKGAFTLRGVTTAGASLHVVNADGSYLGPVVLRASGAHSLQTIKGSGNLRIGALRLRGTYARAVAAPRARVQTGGAYVARAVRGVPIGAGRIGRVTTSAVRGMRGQGGDLDLDGIVGAFDIDDNGNLILDNVDRTGRGGTRPSASTRIAPRSSFQVPVGPPSGGTPTGPPPSGGATTTDVKLFSNFKLTGPTSLNANITTLTDLTGKIAVAVPSTVTLATQVVGGGTATLDCLGNTYCVSHTTDGVAYPLVNTTAATYTGTLLNLTTGTSGDAQITPGALPTVIGAGDAFVERAGGSGYPAMLNFVFNTAPAITSVATSAATYAVSYTADGNGQPAGLAPNQGFTPSSRIPVPADGRITLSWWRPQRTATSGEPASAAGWVDIGGLSYSADSPNALMLGGTSYGTGPGQCALTSYSGTTSNGSAFVNTGTAGVLDPAIDAPANPANTLEFTVDASACFSAWATAPSGAEFDFDIQAQSVYGDNAARKLYFVKS